MTPSDYRDTIAALGLAHGGDISHAAAGRLLGVDETTSRRWAAGTRAVPGPAERFLRWLVASATPAERVMRMLG